MASKRIFRIAWAALLLLVLFLGIIFLWNGSKPTPSLLVSAERREMKMTVSTNGTIEPIDRVDLYSPVDALVTNLEAQEGSEVTQGELMMRLESKQTLTALSEARAALLQARRQGRVVLEGPSQEELASLEASVKESELRLEQQHADLRREEALLKKDATTRAAVESIRQQAELLELQLESLKQRKQELLNRYTAEEKKWEKDRINELAAQVSMLEKQVQQGLVYSPRSGILFSLAVKPGSFVNRGQLMAQVYEPGKVFLRAYVDEPDLGRIEKGQQALIEWDGLPDRQWTGKVDRPAKQVVVLGNRSVGYVICSIAGNPLELIPNINVKVQIVTSRKANALVVPRTAVFNHEGKPTVMLHDGKGATMKAVTLGMVTPQEVEILGGISEGNKVVVDPGGAVNP